MKTLAIETSAKTLSLAVGIGKKISAKCFINDGLVHSEKLFAELQKLLSAAALKLSDIERVVVSIGPGSFTGIRVGMTFAKTLAQVLKADILGIDVVSILEFMNSKNPADVSVLINAGRGEVYFKGSGDIVIKNAEKHIESLNKNKKRLFAGTGALLHKGIIKKRFGKNAVFAAGKLNYPLAESMIGFSNNMKPQKLYAVKAAYVRKSWAEESNPR